jgi:hypothetical protein
MRLDEHDSPLPLTLHEVLVQTRQRCGGHGPSYAWGYRRVLSGELPAEKVGTTWRLPPEAVDALERLWRAQCRRPPCAA